MDRKELLDSGSMKMRVKANTLNMNISGIRKINVYVIFSAILLIMHKKKKAALRD